MKKNEHVSSAGTKICESSKNKKQKKCIAKLQEEISEWHTQKRIGHERAHHEYATKKDETLFLEAHHMNSCSLICAKTACTIYPTKNKKKRFML